MEDEAQKRRRAFKIDPNRPVINNKDGSYSTERSITVQAKELNNGRFTNIPSIWDGRQLEPREAVGRAIKSGQKYDHFDTVEEAEKSAKERSAEIGRRRKLFK
jgi:hypothetical protein